MAGILDKVGEILGLDNNDQVDAAQATLNDILSRAGTTSASNRGLYGDYLSQMRDTYSGGAEAYDDALAKLRDAIDNRGDFTYDRQVSDFYDPAARIRQQQAMDAINASASANGQRFSSGYLDKLTAKQQALASEEWKSSYDRMMQDRQQQLQEWQTGQQKIDNLGTLAGIYGNDRTKLSDAIGDYYSAMANQNMSDLQTYSDITGNKANLDAQRSSGIGSLIGGLGGILSAIF